MRAAHLLILVILLACKENRTSENLVSGRIESLDISPDDQKVLLLTILDGATTVVEINADGNTPKVILTPADDELFANPRYSPDGKKIVFIKRSKTNFWESTVCIFNRDGSAVEELTHGGEIVTEAIFSSKGDQVLYCSAKQYNSIKKKGQTDVRGFDIYSIDLADRKTVKLSKLNALGIDNLSEISEKYVLFHVIAGKKSGIYSLEKDNPTRSLRIIPVNVTAESNLLDKPVFAPDRFLIFTAHSELYTMDLNTRKAEPIFDAKGGHMIEMLKGFHTKPRVLFKKFDEPRLTSLNTDGTEVRSFDVAFPE